MKTKRMIIFLAAVLTAGMLGGCGNSSSASIDNAEKENINTASADQGEEESISDNTENEEKTELRIAAQPFPLYSSVWVAYEKGYLEEELAAVNAEFTWTVFQSGPAS